MIKKTLILFNSLLNYEETYLNYKVDFNTKFNLIQKHSLIGLKKITLNFGFKEIKFEKKQMILYFLILELLSNQKCVLTTSTKNLINLKIKKGMVTGCKVTLRNLTLFEFLNLLLLGLPRSEIFKGFSLKLTSEKILAFSTKLKNLFIFYTIESEILSYIKYLDLSFNFDTLNKKEKKFYLMYQKIPVK